MNNKTEGKEIHISLDDLKEIGDKRAPPEEMGEMWDLIQISSALKISGSNVFKKITLCLNNGSIRGGKYSNRNNRMVWMFCAKDILKSAKEGKI